MINNHSYRSIVDEEGDDGDDGGDDYEDEGMLLTGSENEDDDNDE